MKNNTTMAIEHFNSYPHFIANQVLKCSDLNNSFGFLDEQARLSRLHMVGQGIISGLSPTFMDDGTLCIGEGLAINGGGWVVQVKKDTYYPYVAKVGYNNQPFESDNLEDLVTKGGSRVEYICFESEDDARELGLKPVPITTVKQNNYIIALAYGTRRELSNRCSHDSCDINVTSLLTEAWPVLVRAATNPLFKRLSAFNQRILPFSPIGLPTGSDIKEFNRVIKKAFEEQRKEWIGVIKTIFSQVFGQKYVHTQKGSKGFVSNASPWDTVFSESRQMFGRLNGCIVKVENLFASGKQDFVPDYFLSFLDDLRVALNEMIEAYNEYAAETVYLPDWVPGGQLTYLGLQTKPWDQAYKSLFQKADVLASESAALRLEQMIRRIHILSEHFIGTMPSQVARSMIVNLATRRPGERLSEKPIPFYYKNSRYPYFISAWNADKSSSYRSVADYGTLEQVNGRSENLFAPRYGLDLYLEGYQSKPCYQVRSYLTNTKALNWMKLKVEYVPLRTIRRLTPAQTETLLKYFASDDFKKKCLPAIYEKKNDKMSGLAAILEGVHISMNHSRKKASDFINALRTGESIDFYYAYSEGPKIMANLEELWEMTRIVKDKMGLTYKDKKNKYADPLYSAFLNLFNIIAARTSPSTPLYNTILNGPIRPGSTVFLITADDYVISYAVYY